MRIFGSVRFYVLFAVVLLTFGASAGNADTLIFNVTPASTGSVSFAGATTADAAAASLIGTNIQVQSLTFVPTSGPAVTYAVTGGLLNFTSGNFSGSLDASSPGGAVWFFDGSDTNPSAITLTGSMTIGTTVITNATLLSGYFPDLTNPDPISVRPNALGAFTVAAGSFFDQKNSAMVAALNMPGGTYLGNMAISFDSSNTNPWLGTPANCLVETNGERDCGAAFHSTLIKGGTIQNTPPVPEPGTMLLLGTGLLSLGGLLRRKLFGA